MKMHNFPKELYTLYKKQANTLKNKQTASYLLHQSDAPLHHHLAHHLPNEAKAVKKKKKL